MSALVIYESVHGNTRRVAEAIAAGLHPLGEVTVKPVHEVEADAAGATGLLVVGGPTHMHGMASAMSRKQAVHAAEEEGVQVEPGAAEEPGLRRWLANLDGDGSAAAFDTRIDRSPVLTGVAARGIAKRLRRSGYSLVADPESFFVDDTEGPLAEGELERAREWGSSIATELLAG